ncbi:hypothetical protein MMC26_000900 [Xylographa opegraphella]|nr:hypothetical protein [Xylographa opegraphella]
MPLSALKNSVIGIDAAYYLERILTISREPLLSALGGWPLAYGLVVRKDLDDLQSAGFKVHFVFNGLDYGTEDDPFKSTNAASNLIAKAFQLYEAENTTDAVKEFKAAGVPTSAALSEFLKKVLYDLKVEFTVAPYSAFAQLAYYEKDPSQFVDAIYGPSELFLFGVDKLITKFTLSYDVLEVSESGTSTKASSFSLDNSTFSWIDRRECLEQLGHISPEVFIDACMLTGSNLMDTFPPFRNSQLFSSGYSIRDAVKLLVTHGPSVSGVCAQYQDDKKIKQLDYLDRYKRVMTAIKHHVVITKNGNVETLDSAHAPFDVHDCIGQRLPEELMYYLFRGMIRPRVLNWLTSGKINVTAPYAGGETQAYQKLVKEQLLPWRGQALCLLADSINRYYGKKEVTTRFWFDANTEQKLNLKDLLPSQKNALRTWRVSDQLISERKDELEQSEGPGSSYLFGAIRSIASQSFITKTLGAKESQPLRTTREVVTNVVWRFLQLRQYVDENHNLTAWGKFLVQTMENLGSGSSREQTEAAFITTELLRLGILNPSTVSASYSGASTYTTDADRRNSMFISWVASLGKIRHHAIGYSGPLNRQLLAFQSIVSEVRASLRDLIEMSLVSLFLEGDADRDRKDWMDISLSLPFYEDTSCAVGILFKSYLDELAKMDEPTSESTRVEVKDKAQSWLKHGDFRGSFDDSLRLWDAVSLRIVILVQILANSVFKVYDSVRSFDELSGAKPLWDEVDQWLALRR